MCHFDRALQGKGVNQARREITTQQRIKDQWDVGTVNTMRMYCSLNAKLFYVTGILGIAATCPTHHLDFCVLIWGNAENASLDTRSQSNGEVEAQGPDGISSRS